MSSNWFRRREKGIQTSTQEKKDIPKGFWYKTPSGKIIESEELGQNFYVSPEDGYHVRIRSTEYFSILFDSNKYKELDAHILPKDPLNFEDTKNYKERLKSAQEKTGFSEAIRVAVGLSQKKKIVVCCMDFSFIGGSMGSVVGEKIVRAITYAIRYKLPFMIISKSGGARMMESAFSLMQMAKISAKLTQLDQVKLPYISLSTDPTTGGITASFAMLGDINIAEPGALIGFAGPRIIKDTVGENLPEGFQTSEFILEHGFLDFIVHRKELKNKINLYIDLIRNLPVRKHCKEAYC